MLPIRLSKMSRRMLHGRGIVLSGNREVWTRPEAVRHTVSVIDHDSPSRTSVGETRVVVRRRFPFWTMPLLLNVETRSENTFRSSHGCDNKVARTMMVSALCRCRLRTNTNSLSSPQPRLIRFIVSLLEPRKPEISKEHQLYAIISSSEQDGHQRSFRQRSGTRASWCKGLETRM